jgi:hypothetical protein
MNFEPADLFACHGTDAAATVIRWGTWSPFGGPGLRFGPSHIAICGGIDPPAGGADIPAWVESTSLSRLPCLVRGEPVAGMQVHLPAERIREYQAAGGRVDVYRLAKIQTLDLAETQILNRILIDHMVRPGISYDMRGAILSGLRVAKATSLFPGADLHRLFCSEVVAAVLMRLNRMRRNNPTRYNPAAVLRELVDHGTYYLACRDVQAADCPF